MALKRQELQSSLWYQSRAIKKCAEAHTAACILSRFRDCNSYEVNDLRVSTPVEFYSQQLSKGPNFAELANHIDYSAIRLAHRNPDAGFLLFHLPDDPVDRVHVLPEFLLAARFPIFSFVTNTKPANQATNLFEETDDIDVNLETCKLSFDPASYSEVVSELKSQWFTVSMRERHKPRGMTRIDAFYPTKGPI